ncbi:MULTISPECIES: ABC transporter substrate-binding protein [Pseudofrankia]|uniref:ABC transporter substrate-binding protein n=1 Tax=Pseudofrankia TaxID=2994363 RepID=UPI000234D90E|nr:MULTISPECIES: ABC transporter substrate-binding protein [Pseudofrankia]OHV40680.1 Leu/Ile/Val-binding protein (LIV-BP) [Pseudofrankia sp. EUN1h]
MNLPRLHARTVTVALAVALVTSPGLLSGCGAPSGASGGAASPCPAPGLGPGPGVAPGAIKIGLALSDSGPAAVVDAFKGVRGAVDARVDLQNARGGVGGRRIDLVWQDDQASAAGFSSAVRRLVDRERVFGLIALTVAFGGSAAWLQKKNVPVTGFASSAEWSEYPNAFHFGSLFNKGTVSTFGDYVKAEGGTKAVVVVDPSAATSPTLVTALSASLRSRGVQVVDQVDFTHEISSASSVADELKQSGADALVGSAQAADFIDIYARAKDLGVGINVALNAAGYSSSLLETFGPKMAGMTTISTFAAPGSPAMTAYDNAMTTYSPEMTDPSDEIAIAAYVAADEMIHGLELAGPCPTRAEFIERLRRVTDFTGSGLMPPVDLSKPRAPVLCENFIKADPTGRGFTAVRPPAEFDHDGYWCGQPVPGG